MSMDTVQRVVAACVTGGSEGVATALPVEEAGKNGSEEAAAPAVPRTMREATAQEVFICRERIKWLDNRHFGVRVSLAFPVQDQRTTGRCWLFALCNVARIAWKTDISVSYLAFYDACEKARFFLQQVAKVRRTEKPTGRLLSWLLDSDNLCADGGQWDMAAAVMHKYGVVQKSDYHDCKAHVGSLEFRKCMRTRLRYEAMVILNAADKSDKSDEEMAAHVAATAQSVRDSIIVPFFGEPPTVVTRGEVSMTPKQFYESQNTSFRPLDFCCLVNAPDDNHPMYKKMTIDTLGDAIAYVNVPIDELLRLCEIQLLHGVPVWIGIDWDKDRDIPSGSLDDVMMTRMKTHLSLPHLTKGQMLELKHARMTHAVTLVGFDRKEGEEARFQIENSHGTKGKSGCYHASESWLKNNLYEAAISKRFLPRRILDVYEGDEVIHLDPWDPLGALAQ